MAVGKVYLVGAGPGHPELLTLKAAQLIRIADVLVYDRLIQEEVLALAKPSVERIYMGKPVGRHLSRQDEIHEVLAAKALERKVVVRLKGGDPFLFGRGGEEAEYLSQRGIPFEVIPGVSSALAAPLSAGISITHRDHAAGVAIVTGHEARDEVSRLDWDALAKMDTLVILMGVSNADRIARRLIQRGRDPETPVAAIQMAYWHHEQAVTCTLATLDETLEREGVKPPATLVVGDVVRMRDRLRPGDRDLRRRPDGTSRFEPAPAPDQLYRIATGGMAAAIFERCLRTGLFDELESAKSADSLAPGLNLDLPDAEGALNALVALGILEKGEEGYRNLELASRYLRSDSHESLKEPLLCTCGLPDEPSAGGASMDPLRCEAMEALIRFSAPEAVDRIELAGLHRVHLIGWGAQGYREALLKRWPDLSFSSSNPFAAGGDPSSVPHHEPGADLPYGAVILSGVLASCPPEEAVALLERAGSLLDRGSTLLLHDFHIPLGVLPPPETVLSSLGRRWARRESIPWTLDRIQRTLNELGFGRISAEPLTGGGALITATWT